IDEIQSGERECAFLGHRKIDRQRPDGKIVQGAGFRSRRDLGCPGISAMKRITAQVLESAGIAHGFFGRDGGVSSGLYESLNCGPGSQDNPQAVRQNRSLVAAALAPDSATSLVSLSQVHSAVVHTLAAPPAEGAP